MADVNMEALLVPEDWHFQWPGLEQQTEEDVYEGPETHYFIRHAGCDLCQFSFDPSQTIIAMINGFAVESKYAHCPGLWRSEDGRLGVQVFPTGRVRMVPFGARQDLGGLKMAMHRECYAFAAADIQCLDPGDTGSPAQEAFRAIAEHSFTPSIHDEMRRSQRIQAILAGQLHRKYRPHSDSDKSQQHLPLEICTLIAGHLIREYVIVAAFTNFTARNDAMKEQTVSLDKPVYSSFVNHEGRHYIQRLFNEGDYDSGDEKASAVFRVLLFPGRTKSKASRVRMFVATDKQGVRSIRFFRYVTNQDYRDVFAWCHDQVQAQKQQRQSNLEVLWSCTNIPFSEDQRSAQTLNLKSDGVKLRTVEHKRHSYYLAGGFRIHTYLWPAPLPSTPIVEDFAEHPTVGVHMRLFDGPYPYRFGCVDMNTHTPGNNINDGNDSNDIIGYSVACDPKSFHAIVAHTRNESRNAHTEAYTDDGLQNCVWQYMPMADGESVTEVVERIHNPPNGSNPHLGLFLATNYGRRLVFGPLWGDRMAEAEATDDPICCRLRNPEGGPLRMFVSRPDTAHRRTGARFYAFDMGTVEMPTLDPTPEPSEAGEPLSGKSIKDHETKEHLTDQPPEQMSCKPVGVISPPGITDEMDRRLDATSFPTEEWFICAAYTSCRLDNVKSIQICTMNTARTPHKPIVGMLFSYADGRIDEAIGCWRFDWVDDSKTINVSPPTPSDELHVCYKQYNPRVYEQCCSNSEHTPYNDAYIAAVQAHPPTEAERQAIKSKDYDEKLDADKGPDFFEPTWVSVPWSGILEWWTSSTGSHMSYAFPKTVPSMSTLA